MHFITTGLGKKNNHTEIILLKLHRGLNGKHMPRKAPTVKKLMQLALTSFANQRQPSGGGEIAPGPFVGKM